VGLANLLQTSSAEIGLAFDGDGDRLGIVTKDCQIIYPDRQLLLFAEDVLSRNKGATIIFDVKSTRNLSPWIRKYGGNPLMWKTGHSLVKAKIKETNAALAGEMSGHLFFNDADINGKKRWYGFDDGLYAGARMLEILSQFANPSDILNSLPDSFSTPEQHIQMNEGEPHALIASLQKSANFEGAVEVITIDGLRVEYPDGFGLMRPSNTTPVIVLRFEADSVAALKRIQAQFREVILGTAPHLALPF
jgi:phosphomannomutase/phosphoglucomutase